MYEDLEFNYCESITVMDIFSEKDINELCQWTKNLNKSTFVPKDLSNKQLVLFYSACYGDVEKTKKCVEKYYNCRKNTPEFFNNRVITTAELKLTIEALEFFVLPGKSSEGYDIIYHGINDSDPSKFNLNYICKIIFMTVDLYLTKRGPQPGCMFLFDMDGVRFRHLTKISLTAVRKFFQYVQEAIPIRLKAVHILNTEPILDKLLLLFRPFMEKKYIDMIRLHHKTEAPEKLHEIIPRTSLPSNYGGLLADTQTLHKECMEQLGILEPYFKAEEEQRTAALHVQ